MRLWLSPILRAHRPNRMRRVLPTSARPTPVALVTPPVRVTPVLQRRHRMLVATVRTRRHRRLRRLRRHGQAHLRPTALTTPEDDLRMSARLARAGD